MRWPLHLFAPPSWFRRPRRTARLRLTALYGGLFLLSGAALLTVTYVLFKRASPYPGVSLAAPSSSGISDAASPAQKLHQLAEVSGAAHQLAADQHQLLVNSAIALAIVAVLAIVLGWVVAGRVLLPLSTITSMARKISATNLHQRLALDGADEEFKQLGDTLDDLFARLEASFDAQRHFIASASHELRTPLTADRTLLQVAMANPATTAERWRYTGQELLASGQEQERLIEALLTLASSEGGLDQREPVDLLVLTDRVLLTSRPEIDRLGLHVETTMQPALLAGDALLMERMVANLIDNAVRHNLPGGWVDIKTGLKQSCAVISVSNTGAVIPPGEIHRLLQPFQRLDTRRVHHTNGLGLGLSIVQAIATAHGTAIQAHPHPDGGLTIEVRFQPLTDRTSDNRNRALHSESL